MTKKKTNNTRNNDGRKTTKRNTQSRNTQRNTQMRTSKKTSKSKKNKRQKGVHRKKASLRKKRLIALICLIATLFVVVFIGKKTVGFVSSVWPNVISLKNSMTGGKVDKTDVNSDEQYDMGDERQMALEKKHNIFIDVGCGGNETGYVDGSLKEKDLNLKIAKQVAKQLSRYDDINVTLSRQEDVYMSPDERKSLAESEEAELFVSIHMAAENSGTAEGTETIYYNGASNGSYDFAGVMQTSIVAFVKTENRGINAYEMSVLKDNGMPSIYIQCGFLSNSKDKKNLQDKEYQQELSKGIAQGILSYIDAKK